MERIFLEALSIGKFHAEEKDDPLIALPPL